MYDAKDPHWPYTKNMFV